MIEFGHFSLAFAWLIALVSCVTGIMGGVRQHVGWTYVSRNALCLVGITSVLATALLGVAFQQNSYALQYVWQYSNREMPTVYKWSAIWGGMDGSMLLWCAVLAVIASIVAFRIQRVPWPLAPWVLATLASSLLFFLTVTLFVTNPFRYLIAPTTPANGNGLNPLLQNPYMAIHPPMLYLGFTTLAVPYAFGMAALCSGHLQSSDWVRCTRRWAVLAWAFLTVGITLGGHWAYLELGWGGFWAWDPVENSSFLPWLTATAFLHSIMVQERRGMLKQWNIWLVVMTYALTVFGTFLTRSGIVQSVHSSASSDIGWVFLVYLAAVLLVAGFLTWRQRKRLRPDAPLESFLSRETMFLLNNLILLSICFAVLWGVMFPVLSEALTGTKQTVGIPYFNAVTIPLFFLLLATMGVGQLIAWRRASWKSVKRQFFVPALSSILVGAFLLFGGVTDFYPLTSYLLCVFVAVSLMGEFRRGYRVQRHTHSAGPVGSVVQLLRRHRTRYGGYLVHFGVVIAVVSITASMAFKVEREFTLGIGEQYQIGRFGLTLDSLTEQQLPNYLAQRATLSLRDNRLNTTTTLRPEFRLYRRSGETTSEVALRMGLREDVYIVLAQLHESARATLKLFINPLQVWLWIGVLVMMVGTVVVLLPKVRSRTGEVTRDVA